MGIPAGDLRRETGQTSQWEFREVDKLGWKVHSDSSANLDRRVVTHDQ